MGQSTKASGSAIALYRCRQRPPPRRVEQRLLSHRSTPGSSSPDPRGHKVLRPRSQPRTRTSQRNCTERRALSLDWHRVAAAASTRGKSATTRTTTTNEDSSSIAPCATHRSPALSKPVWIRRDHWKPPPPHPARPNAADEKSASSSVDSGVIDQPLSRPAPPLLLGCRNGDPSRLSATVRKIMERMLCAEAARAYVCHAGTGRGRGRGRGRALATTANSV